MFPSINYIEAAFVFSIERAELFRRHNDVIWQLVKLWCCQITSSWRQKRSARSMELKTNSVRI